MTIDFNKVSQRKAHLDIVRGQLKTEFFGIDGVIDQIIESVQTWYLLPEILVRPPIIGCFGLTGGGKTSLIRSLVNHLGFQNRFVEVQMDGIAGGGNTTIQDVLSESSIKENEPGIILLDEFQRYRTIDQHGNDVEVKRYQDVWMMLSDGRFPSDAEYLARLERRLLDSEYWEDDYKALVAEKEASGAEAEAVKPRGPLKYIRQFYLKQYDAEEIKRILRSSESVKEIMRWPKEKVNAIIRAQIEADKNPPIDYTKCLIFVSGNLDEAFKMADDIEDCDTNADVYHEYSKKVGVIEIKQALAKRFKPEQIARLGNNHVIYPSLSADAYLQIIKRACGSYLDEAHKLCDLRFEIEDGVYQEIYENAVYPTQGTRPVFTSVHKMFGYPISDAILWASQFYDRHVIIGLDIAASCMTFRCAGEEKRVKIDLDIRARRAKHSDDFNALVAVHEAGHAIVYSDLFKMPPVEIAISVASFKGGYNRFKTEHLSREETLNRMAVGFGGIVAEELIFGQELRSTGCSGDIAKTTQLAAEFVREYAMDGFLSHIASEMTCAIESNTDVDSANAVIEQILKEQKARVQTILTAHRDLLIDLSRHLLKVKKMSSTEFAAFIGDRIADLGALTDKDVNGDYAARLLKA